MKKFKKHAEEETADRNNRCEPRCIFSCYRHSKEAKGNKRIVGNQADPEQQNHLKQEFDKKNAKESDWSHCTNVCSSAKSVCDAATCRMVLAVLIKTQKEGKTEAMASESTTLHIVQTSDPALPEGGP